MTIIHDSLFIGGEWVPPSSAGRIEVRNASTGDVIGSVPEAAEADIDAAVAAARRAFDDPSGWSAMVPAERAALERLATELEASPWGGVKPSGLGRELGPGAITAYQKLKTVYA